jgi:hypothetical protein
MLIGEVRMLLKKTDISSTGTKSEIKSRAQSVDKFSFSKNINCMNHDDVYN